MARSPGSVFGMGPHPTERCAGFPRESTALTLQLFEVTPDGPRPLPIVRTGADVNEMFDALPLGIYEGLRTFDHVRFLGLAQHIERAKRSLAGLGREDPLEDLPFRAALHAVVRDYPHPDARVRFDVLAGPATGLGGESTVLIALSPLHPVPPAFLRDGVGVWLDSDLSRPDPHIKHASFVIERRRRPVGPADHYEMILVSPDGHLLEGGSSSFFGVRGGTLCTAVTGVLEGVTSGFVRELAGEMAVPCEPTPVHRDEVGELDEAFMTSSIRSVVPITRIDGRPVGAGAPGPVTRSLMEAYAALAARAAKPAIEA